jgi:hypothetical protein
VLQSPSLAILGDSHPTHLPLGGQVYYWGLVLALADKLSKLQRLDPLFDRLGRDPTLPLRSWENYAGLVEKL